MNSIEHQIINECKILINNNNLDGLKELWVEYKENTEFEREIAWDYIFQKVYFHAALKKQKLICDWLDTIFLEFSITVQIALRQMFSYARYLLNKS
jgi:hypothetical protein